MQRKTFIMLAGPGMIGKSTAAKNACASHVSTSVLENDKLMQQLFNVVRLEQLPISDMQKWEHKVNEKADCNLLIRLHHRDWVARHWQTEIVVAEGYPYMKKWYRNQVLSGLQCLNQEFDYWLLKYNPLLPEQAERRALKCRDFYGWSPQPQAFHEAKIQEDWLEFDPPQTSEGLSYQEVNADQLAELITRLANDPSSK